MKTQKILISLMVLFTMALSTAFGSDVEKVATAKNALYDELNAVVQNVPFEEFIGDVKECKMTIIFKVDENQELTNYAIYSDNESLNRVTEYKLERSDLKADPALIGRSFRIKVNFVNLAKN